MKLTSKTVAREWLVLLGALGVGLMWVPVGLVVLERDYGVRLFYRSLLGHGTEVPLAWACVGLPYLLMQLVRSVRWALATVKGH